MTLRCLYNRYSNNQYFIVYLLRIIHESLLNQIAFLAGPELWRLIGWRKLNNQSMYFLFPGVLEKLNIGFNAILV